MNDCISKERVKKVLIGYFDGMNSSLEVIFKELEIEVEEWNK